MKTVKRVFLSICILAMLIGCMGGFAFADGDYTTYTIQGGDTVLAVCNKLGVDFYANEAWITAVNHIANYRDIKVGKVLYLPLFNTKTDPTKAMNLQNSLAGQTATATTATTPAATAPIAAAPSTTTIASAAAAGDTVVSYLINHVLQAGETVGSVCAQLGVDFDSNADKIKQLSGITNYYHIPVGKKIVIPSLTAPAGSSVTAIIAHKVVGGETVGALCNKYGLDYAKVEAQLKALNSTDNLNRIRVGQTFYLPVNGTVTTATAAGTGTAAASTTTAATAATTPALMTYSISKQNSAHGSFTLQANNGAQLSAATPGTNVKIVATPDSGYKVYTVTVMKTGGEQAVAVNSMSFVMPSYDVTVSVTFKSY